MKNLIYYVNVLCSGNKRTIKKCKLKIFLSVFLLASVLNLYAQTTAWDRAAKIEKGYNLSNWLEASWLGANYPDSTAYTEDQLILFAELGFKTVRVPMLYEWTITQYPPYDTISAWGQPAFDLIDSTIIPVADQYEMTVILDNHHGRPITDSNFTTEIPRICGQWKFLTQYYANLPHDRYFFELRHQPGSELSNENLRVVQQAIIDTIRTYDSERTLIVKANWWSAPYSLSQTTPYNDDNIIYMFLTYDPHDFTHQGLSWTYPPYKPTGVTFSANNPEAIALDSSLIKVKNWSETYNVPIFWGEFGVSSAADAHSRCNYIDFTMTLAEQLDIPWIYWDIKNTNDAFGIFENGLTHQANVIPCFANAMGLNSSIYPGDADANGKVEALDVLYWGAEYGNTGPIRPDADTAWIPQPCENWSVAINGVNGKHQDANGDGIINDDDLNAIIANFDNLTPTYIYDAPSTNNSDYILNIVPVYQNGDSTIFELILERTDNLQIEVSGLAFSFEVQNAPPDLSIVVDIENSDMGDANDLGIVQRFDSITSRLDAGISLKQGNTVISDSIFVGRIIMVELVDGFQPVFAVISNAMVAVPDTIEPVNGQSLYSSEESAPQLVAQPAITAFATVTHSDCSRLGEAQLHVLTPGNYTYSWSHGANTAEVQDLAQGMYSVTISEPGITPAVIDNIIVNAPIAPPLLSLSGIINTATYHAADIITSTNIISQGGNVSCKAGQTILMKAGFSVENNANFSAEIENCGGD